MKEGPSRKLKYIGTPGRDHKWPETAQRTQKAVTGGVMRMQYVGLNCLSDVAAPTATANIRLCSRQRVQGAHRAAQYYCDRGTMQPVFVKAEQANHKALLCKRSCPLFGVRGGGVGQE